MNNTTTETLATTKWNIDPAHSEVLFKVKHLMISNVTGTFAELGADVELQGADLIDAKVEFWANVNSVETGSADRDNHLRGADFFDADHFQKLTFRSTSVTKSGDDYAVIGDLTIKDVTKPVTLKVEWSGLATDPWGNTKAGLSFTGKIDRREFGLTWNAALEAGGVLVSDEVRLLGEVQLVKAK